MIWDNFGVLWMLQLISTVNGGQKLVKIIKNKLKTTNYH